MTDPPPPTDVLQKLILGSSPFCFGLGNLGWASCVRLGKRAEWQRRIALHGVPYTESRPTRIPALHGIPSYMSSAPVIVESISRPSCRRPFLARGSGAGLPGESPRLPGGDGEERSRFAFLCHLWRRSFRWPKSLLFLTPSVRPDRRSECRPLQSRSTLFWRPSASAAVRYTQTTSLCGSRSFSPQSANRSSYRWETLLRSSSSRSWM